MKATGTDARGRGVGKRDAKSLRKLSMKISRDVRLDIQDVLEIPTVSDIVANGVCRRSVPYVRTNCLPVNRGLV